MLTNGSGKPERVAIYCRVSGDEQAEAGTIQNQTDFAQRYTDLHSLILHDYYLDDGVSGTLPVSDRPGGARLLEDARAGRFNVVLVYKLDRFARRLRVLLDGFETLDALGIGLRSMTQPFDTSTAIGRLFMQMMGSFAEYERETIMERTALGKARALRDGRWIGGPSPLGYRVVEKRLAVEPAEAALVQRIFRLYVEDGLGTVGIADLLNAEGVPTLYTSRQMDGGRWEGKDLRWNPGTISRILHCTAYAGTYQAGRSTGKQTAEFPTPAIVEQATFDQAQHLLKDRFAEAARNAKRFYLLRGLIRCHCGRVVVGEGHRKEGRFYYACPEGHYRQRAEVLEDRLWQDVARFARDPGDVLDTLRAQLTGQAKHTEDAGRELAEVAKVITAKRQEQDAIITLYRRGRISEAQLDSQLDELAREVATLEARQQALFSRQAQATNREAALLSAEALLMRLRERVQQIEEEAASGDPERQTRALHDKRDIFKGLIGEITVDEDEQLHPVYVFSGSYAGVS